MTARSRIGFLSLATLGTALGIASGNAFAQERLMDIYQRALQNDPQIREAEANFRSQSEVRPQARSQLLPSMQFSTQTTGSRSEDPRRPTDFVTGAPNPFITGTETRTDRDSWSVSLNQTVFDWGRIVSLRQADKRVAQAEIEYERARQALLVRVAEAYFNVLAAEDTLAAQVGARESFARQLEQAQRRFEVGLIAITDVQQAQAAYDSAVADEIAAQRTVASSQEVLREIIGAYVADIASVGDDLPLVPPDPPNPDRWVDIALQQNLALVSSRIQTEIAQDSIAIERSSRLPTVSFSTSWNDQSTQSLRTLNLDPVNVPPTPIQQPGRTINESQGYNWSLNLNVPLFTGGLNRSRIQQSVYQHRASSEALERIARQTEREARDAYLGVVSDISRVSALRQAVESNRTALSAVEAGFDVGTRTTVDVVVSQNALRQAETNYARSRYEYILNVLRLKLAAGSLNVEDIEDVDGWLR
jgi:outer membrane protein